MALNAIPFLRGWMVDCIPRDVHGDEGWTIRMWQTFWENPDRDWFGARASFMNLLYVSNGVGTAIFGTNLGGARAASALYGAVSVALLYDGLRRVATRPVAIVAALFLAVHHCHLAYSRTA